MEGAWITRVSRRRASRVGESARKARGGACLAKGENVG